LAGKANEYMASRSWNRIELIGNLTRDPELRFTPNGAAVCTFGIATNRSFVSSEGEKREDVDFHRLVAWNKLAELCNQLLKKGTKVFVSGRLQYRDWETQEGQKRREAEIVLEDMIILSSKGAESSSEEVSDVDMSEPAPRPSRPAPKAEEPKAPRNDTPDETVSDDDLPF
jgi:single-strand DNA-binding protein